MKSVLEIVLLISWGWGWRLLESDSVEECAQGLHSKLIEGDWAFRLGLGVGCVVSWIMVIP